MRKISNLLAMILTQTKESMKTSLIFVYNTDGGPINGLLDIGHKIFSPDTYDCSLCALTHDTFAEKGSWREFRTSVGMPMEFLHRDEFEAKYNLRFKYPVILSKNDETEVLLNKEQIDAITSLDDLIETIRQEMTKKF